MIDSWRGEFTIRAGLSFAVLYGRPSADCFGHITGFGVPVKFARDLEVATFGWFSHHKGRLLLTRWCLDREFSGFRPGGPIRQSVPARDNAGGQRNEGPARIMNGEDFAARTAPRPWSDFARSTAQCFIGAGRTVSRVPTDSDPAPIAPRIGHLNWMLLLVPLS